MARIDDVRSFFDRTDRWVTRSEVSLAVAPSGIAWPEECASAAIMTLFRAGYLKRQRYNSRGTFVYRKTTPPTEADR